MERLAREEVQTVAVHVVVRHDHLLVVGIEAHHGLEHQALALLDVLAHGVQVGGEVNARGEETLVVLALALAVELLPPLRHEAERRLKAGEQFRLLAGAVKCAADRGILPRGVGEIVGAAELHHVGGAAHKLVDVDTGDGDGQQAHSGQHTVAAADIVGHHEGLIALGVREALERAAGAVGGGVDALRRFRLAVLLLQQLLEEAERDRRLGGRAGLGDDVHGEVHILDEVVDLLRRGGGKAVAHEVDVGRVLFLEVVVRGAETLDHAACTEIRAADADDDQRLGIALDLLRRLFDAGELVLIVRLGQLDPADEIVALAAAVLQPVRRLLQLAAQLGLIGAGEEGYRLGNVNR